MKFEVVIVGSLETNCYLVYCPQTLECAVVDPGAEPHKIIHSIIHNKLKPVIILNTHGHVDHIGANQNIKEKYNIPLAIHDHIGANQDIKEKYNIPLAIHPGDKEMLANVHHSELSFFLEARESPPPDILLEEGERIKIGQSELEVLFFLAIHSFVEEWVGPTFPVVPGRN